MVSHEPPFKAEVVGSLLRPAGIHAARERRAPADGLRRIETECVRDAVALQKSVGLAVCTDGEFHRRHWFLDFIERIDGVTVSGSMAARFHNAGARWTGRRLASR
jgi:5-methyltetrahydropteroyltriglutamate--homocysteine methyltransferase